MLLIWRSTEKSLVSHIGAQYEDDSALFIHESFTGESDEEPKQIELQKIAKYVPDLLKRDLISAVASAYTDDNIMPMLSGRTIFETHSDLIGYYLGDGLSDRSFELTRERWIKGLNECVQTQIKKDEVRLVVLYGQKPDPLPLYLASLLRALGVDTVKLLIAYTRPTIAEAAPIVREMPAPSSSVNLLDPETFGLLMCYFYVHPAVYPAEQHPALNVSGITNRIIGLHMDEYMPAHRGKSRGFEGLKKSLKNISLGMEREGLLRREVGSDHNFRLTPLGHLYARTVFGMRHRIKDRLSEEGEYEAALIQLIQGFDSLSKMLVS